MFRPRAARRVWFGLAMVGALVLFRLLIDARRPHAVEADLIAFGPLAVGALAVLGVYLRNARLTIDRDTITRIDVWGHPKTWPKDAVERVDRFRTAGGYGTRYAVFVGQDGRKLFSLNSPFWELGRVVDVCRHLRIHLTGSFQDVESPYGLNRRVPGMTTWRSWALGIGLVAVIVALVIVAVMVSGSPSGG